MGRLCICAASIASLTWSLVVYGHFIFWWSPGPLLLVALLVLVLTVVAFLRNDLSTLIDGRQLGSPLRRELWTDARWWLWESVFARDPLRRLAVSGSIGTRPLWMERSTFKGKQAAGRLDRVLKVERIRGPRTRYAFMTGVRSIRLFTETSFMLGCLIPAVVVASLLLSYFAVGRFVVGQDPSPMLQVLTLVFVASVFGLVDRGTQIMIGGRIML